MTAKFTLTTTPVEISSGAKKIYASSRGSCFKVAVDANTPNKESYHFESKIAIHEGTKVWAWSDHGVVIIDVSTIG